MRNFVEYLLCADEAVFNTMPLYTIVYMMEYLYQHVIENHEYEYALEKLKKEQERRYYKIYQL